MTSPHPRRSDRLERALHLRACGWSFSKIAASPWSGAPLYSSRQAAQRAVNRALGTITAEARIVQDAQQATVDELVRVIRDGGERGRRLLIRLCTPPEEDAPGERERTELTQSVLNALRGGEDE
jgi:hypothetical protein